MTKSVGVLAIVKSVLAVALVGVVVWSVIAEVAIDDAVLKVILAVLGAYFGFSARYYWAGYRNRTWWDRDV